MRKFDATVHDLNDQIQAIIRQQRIVDAQFASSPTLDLTRQELYVVEQLGSNGPCIMSALAKYLMVAGNTVTSVVDGLERKGFVRRERSPENRRKVWVHLTDAGRAAYAAHLQEHLRMAQVLLSALNADEQQIFLVLMRKIGRAASTFQAKADVG